MIACAMCLIITLTLLTGKLRSGNTLRIPLTLKNSLLCLGAGLLASLSVKKGSKIVKPFLIAVAAILVIQAVLKIL